MNKKEDVKKKLGRPAGQNPVSKRMPEVRVSEQQLNSYQKAAVKSGKTFSAWVRGVLDKGTKK